MMNNVYYVTMNPKILFIGILILLAGTSIAFANIRYLGPQDYEGRTVKVNALVGYNGLFLEYVDPETRRYTTEPITCNIYRRYRYWDVRRDTYRFKSRHTIWGQTAYNSRIGGYDKQRCVISGKVYVRSQSNRRYFKPDD